MRRVRFVSVAAAVLAAFLALPIVGGLPQPAFADPSASASASATATDVAGHTVCSIGKSVVGFSGLVATSAGYTLINDSQTTKSDIKIFYFNSDCEYKSSVSYASDAYDPEDLGQTSDGTLWIADTGDNPPSTSDSTDRRATIALWSLASGSTKPVIHRFTYPDTQHDCEATDHAGGWDTYFHHKAGREYRC